MQKIFLLMFPHQEYFSNYSNDINSDYMNSFKETINKRYRNKGYNIYYLIFPDKEIYGLDVLENDIVINTDITYQEYNNKHYNNRKYPNKLKILKQLESFEELIIGGFYHSDYLKIFTEEMINLGLNCSIDLDLTDKFYSVYKDIDFIQDEYNKDVFKNIFFKDKNFSLVNDIYKEQLFEVNFSSKAYGFDFDYKEKLLRK